VLDIRAVAYIAPLSEVDFAPVTLTVRLVNMADETGLVTGMFRVYNASTGLLIHTSDIVPVSMPAGATVDASALTNWDPPGPAVDVYQVTFSGSATNALVPDGIVIFLGLFTFDVKPAPLGPVPAGHHVTHEDTGIDEVDVTGLSGLLADPQTPEIHDNTKHNPVMEEAANKGIAGGYCGLPNPLDTTLPLRADGTAAIPTGLIISSDFVDSSVGARAPWTGAGIASGSTASVAGVPNHPGIVVLRSAAGANSGYRITIDPAALSLAGSEEVSIIFRPQTLAGLLVRMGIIDTITSADCTNGCYLEIATVGPVPGTAVGKCAAGGARLPTPTSIVLVSNTWYRLAILLDSAANTCTFKIFSEAGALLWTDSLGAPIPTGAGKETGCGIAAVCTAAGAVAIVDLDMMLLRIGRPLIR